MNWQAMGREAANLLSEYIRINTTNPPGNELQGALFLKRILEKEGIEVRILDTDELGTGRANLYARFRGTGRKRAIALVHHIDVVPADPSFWKVDPFGGILKDGYIWGRGALDMKGQGVVHLLSLLAIKRSGIPLSRDIVFIANSDEELLGTKGAAVFIKRHRDLLKDVEYVITEGISNRVESGHVIHYSVVTAEKLNYSQRLTVTGTPSHASRPNPDNPIFPLLAALDKIVNFKAPIKITPPVQKYFSDMAPVFRGDEREWASDIRSAVTNERALRWVLSDPTWHAHLRNTAQVTVLKGSNKTNVVPSEASAEIDIRVLPGEDPEAFRIALENAVNDKRVRWTRLYAVKPRLSSPIDTDLFRAIERTARQRSPGAVVTTPLSVGGTDMPWYRELGCVVYGIDPFLVERVESLRGQHGNDERLSLENLTDGIKFVNTLLRNMN